MKDLVTRGTGNSRLLKSSIPAGTTWDEALALLRAGNFPIDLNGLNSAGVSTTGSAYSKANVLPDSLCSSLGITPSTAEPKDAWNALLQKANTINTSLNNFINNDFPQPSKQGVSRPNILDNWYFVGGGSQSGRGVFPINQKGSASYTAAGYCIDRWRKASGTGTVSLGASGLTITGTGSEYVYINQPIEFSNKLYGKQVTVSILNSSGAVASVTATLPSSQPSTTTSYGATSAIGNVRVAIMGNSSYFYVELYNSSVSGTAIQAVKLELGPNQTLARQSGSTWVLNEVPHFATELLKCQRHMLVFGRAQAGSFSSYLEDAIGTGFWYDSSTYYGFIPTPITMRAQPAFSGYLYLHYNTNTHSTVTADSGDLRKNAPLLRPNGISLVFSTGTHTANTWGFIAGGDSTAIFDANM